MMRTRLRKLSRGSATTKRAIGPPPSGLSVGPLESTEDAILRETPDGCQEKRNVITLVSDVDSPENKFLVVSRYPKNLSTPVPATIRVRAFGVLARPNSTAREPQPS